MCPSTSESRASEPAGLAHALLQASPDGLWLIDLTGATRWANDTMAAMVGRTLPEFLSCSIADLTDEAGSRHFEAHLELMRAGHRGLHNEDVLLVRPDGQQVWALVSWAPAHADDGSLLGYLHRVSEYTERRELVERVRVSEAQQAEAQAIAGVGSWSWDLTTDVIVPSSQLLEIWDRPVQHEPYELATFFDSMEPDDRTRVTDLLRRAIEHDQPFEWEGRIVRRDGTRRWVRGLGVVERDELGRALSMTGTTQDITAMREAADTAALALRRLHLLQQLTDAANRSTTVLDTLVRVRQAVHGFADWRILGVFERTEDSDDSDPALVLVEPAIPWAVDSAGAADSAAGLPSDLVADLDAVRRCWTSASVDEVPIIAGTDESPVLVSLPVTVGSAMHCVVQVEVLSQGPSTPETEAMRQHICDLLSRVAERELVSLQLAEARDAAMEASRHKSEFLATMSHEIRTPLNGVIGLNELMLRTELDERQLRLCEGLQDAGASLLALVNDILDLSKIESGRLELEETPFDLVEAIADSAALVAGPAADKGLELVVDCPPDLPRAVRGDPVRLSQVLLNLGSNAVKFTDEGEVVVRASSRLVTELEGAAVGPEIELRIEVRDTGIGLGPDQAERLFEAFTQADQSTTRRHGGTGLGLTISRRLVEAMGGQIGVDTSPEVGSTFWFTARLRLDEAPRRRPTDEAAGLLHERRVLVVDDNHSAASVLTRQLAAWGLRPEVATTGEHALAALSAVDYDLVLVDGHLPDLDAMQLPARARAHLPAPDRPPAFLLLYDTPALRNEHVAAAGFAGWAAKPVRAGELWSAMTGAVAGPDQTIDDLTPARSADRADAGGPRGAGHHAMHVLVAEDNPVNQLVAVGLLERFGCRTTVVDDGSAALAALRPGHDVDLVLMDCRMPGTDGFEATRAIRAQEEALAAGPATSGAARRVVIVAMTASALTGERQRCLDAGMDDFLTKPVDPDALHATLALWRADPEQTDPEQIDPERSSLASMPEACRQATSASSDPPPVVAWDPAVLDPDRVAMLDDLVKDGVTFFERTRASFLGRVQQMLDDVAAALAERDAHRLRAGAHLLKGSALNIGLPRVGEAAQALESLADSGSVEGGSELFEHLRDRTEEATAVLASCR